jgi:hypothetical protein
LPEGRISQAEIDRALEGMNAKKSFEQIIWEYKEKGNYSATQSKPSFSSEPSWIIMWDTQPKI